MADQLPAHFIRRGWDSEIRRHRDELSRAITATARSLDELRNNLGRGEEPGSHAARQLVIDASEVAQRVAALAALDQVSFALPDRDH
jgi:hypothetical protein